MTHFFEGCAVVIADLHILIDFLLPELYNFFDFNGGS